MNAFTELDCVVDLLQKNRNDRKPNFAVCHFLDDINQQREQLIEATLLSIVELNIVVKQINAHTRGENIR